MNDIEHFDPMFIYRSGHLQKVPDALSRMLDLIEERDLADTEHLFGIELKHFKTTLDEISIVIPRKCDFYAKLHVQLSHSNVLDKQYEVSEDGKLWNRYLRTLVIYKLEDLRYIVNIVHKDLGHYGKQPTFFAVKQRYEIATDLSWEEGEKKLSSCIPCQLYRLPPHHYLWIHPYSSKRAFEMWEIDFVGLLPRSNHSKRYFITGIDCCTGKAFAIALEKRFHNAAIKLLEKII